MTDDSSNHLGSLEGARRTVATSHKGQRSLELFASALVEAFGWSLADIKRRPHHTTDHGPVREREEVARIYS